MTSSPPTPLRDLGASAVNPIPNQVKLPLSAAMEVVLQGIRIRLGRSPVTLGGVAMGIAFLMAMLTGGLARRGVVHENDVRNEIKRMVNFLLAESGPISGRTIEIIPCGALNEVEERFILAIRKDAGKVRLATHPATRPLAVIILGDHTPHAFEPDSMGYSLIAFTRPFSGKTERIKPVQLSRQPTTDELAAAAKDQRRTRFREAWILIIALAVTVIGIGNAMLMSVTERFREIGTMKCLGALSSFIRRLFVIESALVGIVGGFAGAILGATFALLMYAWTYGFALVFSSMHWPMLLLYAAGSVAAGIVLSIVAAIYPARIASKMLPAMALRSNV